jgi:hypothetical protein
MSSRSANNIIQHTPAILRSIIVGSRIDVHDLVTELSELCPLQRFSEEVADHLLGRTMLHHNLARSHSILDKEIAIIDMSSSLSPRSF